jgi:signal transduction histidine kinase
MIGHTIDELVRPEQIPDLDEAWRNLLDRGEIESEWELIRPDGARRFLEWDGKAHFLPGRHLMVARDVTERKALEAQLLHSQRMEAVGRLAGGIAHDFNNLLTAIQGYSDFLLGELPRGSEPWLDAEQIARASERAESLVRQLLTFSRKQVLQPEVIDLNAIVRDIDSMLRRLIGEDIELETALDPGLAWINADAAQIEQLIINLAVNAREAMPDGGSLRIGTGNVPDGGARGEGRELTGPLVSISVEDTGIGMDEETKLRAFEPFFTTKDHGTGLGLSTAYGIVTQSGGKIDVESAPGKGAVFSAYFPAVHAAGRRASQRTDDAASPNGGSETVLLVEDEDVVRDLAHRILSMSGYKVIEAGSGEEALQVADTYGGTIDLLVTDVVMPGMNGRELADRLLELKPGTRILYMSGYTEDIVIQRGVSEDRAFIAKPFTPAELIRTVRVALDAPSQRSLS